MNISGKTIIITGANGSLGKQLVLHFSKKNEVVAIARQATPAKEIAAHCTYIQADINHLKQDLEADILIHSAGLVDDKEKWKNFFHTNVLGTENIAQFSKNVQQFIFISSSAVYMPSPNLIGEKDAARNGTRGLSNYGKSKYLAEERLKEISEHKSCFILRPRALYGVGDTKIIPRMLRLYKNNTLTIPGTMELRVSLTHFDNLMYGIECCLNSQLQGIHTYNIADDETYILIDFVRKILHSGMEQTPKEKHIPTWLLQIIGRLHLAGMSPLLVRGLTQDMELDLSKIKDELGYLPKQNLKLSLPQIGTWIREKGGVNSSFFNQAH
jgi:nucleoside-diphosphate-sugar epimerase